MKTIKFLTALTLVTGIGSIQAQDFNDTNQDSHTITITVPEVALLDIVGADGEEASADIGFDLDANAAYNITEAGEGFDFSSAVNSSLWVNYTSVMPNAGVASRKITVGIDNQTNVPGGLKITLTTPQLNADNGDEGNLIGSFSQDWTDTSGPVFGVDPADVVTGIGSVYTGEGAGKGLNLRYQLSEDGTANSFQDLEAGNYVATFIYTLADVI